MEDYSPQLFFTDDNTVSSEYVLQTITRSTQPLVITDVKNTEIKAMEKVFQKVLPTFTDNINELTKVTKELKKK